MPFERRSAVQVLEEDRSDKCCNAQLQSRAFLTLCSARSHKLAACKTLAIRLPCPFSFTFLLSFPSVLCRAQQIPTTAVAALQIRGLSIAAYRVTGAASNALHARTY